MTRLHRSLISLLAALGLIASVAASAQEKPAAPRLIDQVTGMLLYCWSIVDEPWTKDLCALLDKEAATRAKAGNIRFVALKTSDTDASNKQKARDAGFDPTNAVWVLVKVERLAKVAGWGINVRADARALPQPEDKGQERRLFFTQSATINASLGRREAERAGKVLIEGLFLNFTRPIKPAQ